MPWQKMDIVLLLGIKLKYIVDESAVIEDFEF